MNLRVTLPPPLRRGDRIGVAALSGKVDQARLAAGLAALEALGYVLVEAANLRRSCGIFAGSDDERLDAFHALAADESLGAIVFARGGHGALRVLPRIDWDLLARRPRAYVGYSDLTPFLLQVVARLRLATFHGPMVAADFARGLDAEELSSFEAALGGAYPRVFAVSAQAPERAPEAAVVGPLLGGCISLLVATLGTPYAPDLEGALLFVEDLGEPLYRFDRMLTHLRLSGNLAKLRGVVAGHLEGESCDTSAAASQETLLRQLRREAEGFSWPVAWGLAAGHSRPNLTLPLGLPGRLDPVAGLLTVGEMESGSAGR